MNLENLHHSPYYHLETIINKLYECTYPNGGMDDHIFFEANDALNYLKEQFEYVDFNSPDDRDEKDLYFQIKNEIESMKYFIAFRSDDISEYFVDDFHGYVKDLTNQIMDIVGCHLATMGDL